MLRNMNKVDKTALLQLRLTPEEKQEWSDIAASHGISLSELVRIRVNGARKSRKKPSPNVDPILLREIVRIGTNINQIAKALNISHTSPSERLEAVMALTSLREWSEAILKAHRRLERGFEGDDGL